MKTSTVILQGTSTSERLGPHLWPPPPLPSERCPKRGWNTRGGRSRFVCLSACQRGFREVLCHEDLFRRVTKSKGEGRENGAAKKH